MITHDRWLRIKEIFQSAQAKEPGERLDFLNEICGDDESLREEVEALLVADASNDDFLDTPALEFAKSILPEEPEETPEFAAGDKVGRYTIQRLLGAGGMGSIYLAQDERLGRKVALKFIAREFATDPRRVQRFEQEARVVSLLNHPNVCVIHETGVTENVRHYIAMEYIQGITLREKLQTDSLTPLEAVHIAIHVAAALGSAHAAGIVHRDIKPENIMLRPDGYVKVLDFGLAKLVEHVPQGAYGSSATVKSEAGMLMGTVKYMSPEQLREPTLDERTDVWSLGVVLYEMLTRTTPFDANTPSESIALILGSPTPPLAFADQLPARFGEIVRKAIERDRALRYRTVNEFQSDLNALKKDLERQMENGIDYAQPPAWLQPVAAQKTQGTQPTRTMPSSAIFTRFRSQALSTADSLLSKIEMHKTAAVFTGATGVLLLLLLIPGAARFISRKLDNDGAAQQVIAIKQLTNTMTSLLTTSSRDSNLVAYVEEFLGKQRVVILSPSTTDTWLVSSPEDVHYLGLTFSRDNSHLYVTRKENHGPGILYRIALPGVVWTRITEGVDSPISLSPAGDQFAFVRLNATTGEHSVIVADIDGGAERVLATRKDRQDFSTYGLSWSPDGTTIVCPAGRWDQGFHMELIGLDVKTGEQKVIGEKDWFSVYQIDWQEDMSGLIVCARERETTPHQIWRVSYPDGQVQKVTTDLKEYKGVSVAGDNIVTVQTERSWRIWVATPGTAEQPRQVSSGVGFTYGLSWAANGSIVYSAMAQDRLNISRLDPNGNKAQLTHAGDSYNPVASSDGRFVVFASNRNDGRFNLWRMDLKDGGGLKQLTFNDANFYPSISPDNKWVAYDNQSDAKMSIWRVPVAGGEPEKIIDGYRMPVFSPDGQLIAARYNLESGSRDLAIFSADGREVRQRVPIPILEWQRVQWLNNHTLSYIDSKNGASNLWSYDLNTAATKQLTFFDSDQIVAYAWSPDFKQVACQRVTRMGDVTKISSER
jgi:eukaryotic-like serine/threonine-protein kinase